MALHPGHWECLVNLKSVFSFQPVRSFHMVNGLRINELTDYINPYPSRPIWWRITDYGLRINFLCFLRSVRPLRDKKVQIIHHFKIIDELQSHFYSNIEIVTHTQLQAMANRTSLKDCYDEARNFISAKYMQCVNHHAVRFNNVLN